MEKLWTTSEVAKFLGVTEADVEELVKQGALTGYKLGGQFLRFRPQQVETLKGKMRFRPSLRKSAVARLSGAQQLKDFFYFYDFYIVSASLLAIIVVYLIVAG